MRALRESAARDRHRRREAEEKETGSIRRGVGVALREEALASEETRQESSVQRDGVVAKRDIRRALRCERRSSASATSIASFTGKKACLRRAASLPSP